MGRPKNKSGSAPWKPRPHSLRKKARNKLEFALGLDSRRADESRKLENAFLEIGYWAGIYKDAIEAYKDMPQIADYRNSLSRFSRDLLHLRDKLKNYAQWERNSIETCGIDLTSFEDKLEAFAAISRHAESGYAKQEPRGKPKDEPRLIVVNHLRRIFRKYYISGATNLEAEDRLKDKKYAELNFVEIILKDAGIPCPENLSALFVDPLAAPYSERANILAKLGRKQEKARLAKIEKARLAKIEKARLAEIEEEASNFNKTE